MIEFDFSHFMIHILVVVFFIPLFFNNSFLKYSISLIVFTNSLLVLAAAYSAKLGNQYKIFQYALIGYSFVFFALIVFLMNSKNIENDIDDLENV